MKRYARGFIVPALAAGLLGLWTFARPQPARPQQTPLAARRGGEARFRILLGIGDSEPARWDGSVRVAGGAISAIEVWRPGAEDQVEGQSWKVSTRRLPPRPARPGARGPVAENGVIVSAELTDPAARFDVQTAQGSFSFRADQVALGQGLNVLDGHANIERVPWTAQITSSIEEEDYPAVAQAGDTVYIAFVEFTHGNRSLEWPRPLTEKPGSFEALARPVGGDQVRLIEYSKSRRTWSAPYAVSPARQDIFRTAIAVDGEGRVWVIWSANVGGNYDLYARCRQGRHWSEEMRLTQDPGPDLSPVAVTDAAGAVWVAWQGYRRDNFEVLAKRQQGEGFGKEERVSISPGNDWAPQIASAGNGEVAVVWDTYDKGDYDVYLRRLHYSGSIGMEAPLPIAATQKFEARPSVAYDGRNRLWVAYEEGFRGWGKDFGAYETTGSGLYQGSTVRVKVLQGSRYFTTADKLEDTVNVTPVAQPKGRARGRRAHFLEQAGAGRPELPDPGLAAHRPPSLTPYQFWNRSTGLPRLAADGKGIVFLAYRSSAPLTRGPLGSVWFENVAYFDGKEWTGPIFLPHSDNLLDNRPALAAIGPGDLLAVGSTDHRFSLAPGPAARRNLDAYNNDLVAAEIDTEAQPKTPELVEIPAEKPEASSPDVSAEREQVALLRNYRVKLGKETLQLLRGEFHRHTELSADGGRDGPLVDAYRYMIDAASMDWVGCCDHDNGGGREYSWWLTQKYTDAFYVPGRFVPMFSYERSVRYPEGHRNVVFARRGIRPLPRLPKMADDSPPGPAPDTQMLYEYLRRFDAIVASHTSGTDMGTDWRDNDPKLEPVVEIYQGDRQSYERPGAPRSNSAGDSIGGWRPLGFVSLALQKGYRLGFESSSDHISTHMSYCNLWVTSPTRAGVLEAFKKRRVYGSTDNILAEVTAAGHFMGEEFRASGAPTIHVKLVGTADFARVHIIKDGDYVYSTEPRSRTADFSWRDNAAKPGATSYYYVRGEQSNGELVWVSPMWITVE
ncbi:MAG TPA: hypothetical protein VEU62_23775 [Bryobacterales bacterium]|nr:hypothetical protein [Bryobacterales bacterium]